jgi:HK97 gp10 family phage protein
MVTIRVDGIDKIRNFTNRLSSDLQNKRLEVLKKGADEIITTAKETAPVRTGFMRDHIRLGESTDTKIVGESPAPYSGFVNFGSSGRKANPFWSSAVDKGKQTIPKQMLDAMAELVKQ